VFDKTLILQYLCIGNGVFLQNLEFNFSPVTDDIKALFHWVPFQAENSDLLAEYACRQIISRTIFRHTPASNFGAQANCTNEPPGHRFRPRLPPLGRHLVGRGTSAFIRFRRDKLCAPVAAPLPDPAGKALPHPTFPARVVLADGHRPRPTKFGDDFAPERSLVRFSATIYKDSSPTDFRMQLFIALRLLRQIESL
jgi:hypothetical protein